jgi:glycosyltransferase involved in cell wall biosynthesis
MKIHFFVRTLNEKTGGGSHYNSIAYIRALKKNGHEVAVHVFSGSGGNSYPSDFEVISHEGWGLGFLKSRAYLSKLLRQYENDADAYFLYAVEFAWGGGLYRKQGGKVPVVVYMDAYLPSMNNVHKASVGDWIYHFKRLPWDKTVGLDDANHVDQFLPCSPYIGEEYKKFGFPKNRFTVLPNIVPDKSAPHVGGGEEVRILYIGRLIYDKGIDLLLKALAQLKEYKWKLVVVGDGPMLRIVKEAAKELPIEMVGWVPQESVGEWYAKSDIFVLPARWPDPAPRTVVDALYAKLPMILPDTGGSSWIAGDAGTTFKTGDLVSLTETLRTILRDQKEATRKSADSAALEAKKFSEQFVIEKMQQIFSNLVSKKV